MLSDSPDGCNYRLQYRQDACTCSPENWKFHSHWFLNPRNQPATVFVFGIIVFLMTSCCIILQAPRYKKSEIYDSNLKENTSEGSIEIQQISFNLMEQRIEAVYCYTSSCEAISCSSIPKDSNSVASSFIEDDFKAQCKDAASVKLSFNNCKFPENTLRRNWLRTNVSIEELTLNSCYLSEIEDDAFSSRIYEETKTIILVKNKLASLRRAMFRHIKNLQYFTVHENIIKSAEFNLLENVADSLTILDLSQAITDREVLRNITGRTSLPHLQTLSLQGNSISMIDAELFAGVPSVKALYLDSSKIQTVSYDVLKPLVSSISKLTLNNNNIVSLPQGLLNSIMAVNSNQQFSMFIQGNPWRCDCDMKWMQDLLQSYPRVITSDPVCKTPERNAMKSFTKAEFCPHPNSTDTIAPTVSGELTTLWSSTLTPTTAKETINVACYSAYELLQTISSSRKLLSTDILQFPSRFANFSVSDSDQGLLVHLPDLDKGVTLLWFDNSKVDSLHCAKNVKHSYLVQSIDPQTAYTICLLVDNEDTVSPLNCLAMTTSPKYEHRTWLANADKSLVYTLFILSLIVLFLVGGLLSFLLVRRHPMLLRGSKRVMVVKRRNVDAIVLAKCVDVDGKKQDASNTVPDYSKLQEDGYVTPLPPERLPSPRRSRVSRTSLQSDKNSYVSEIEPTESQMNAWRLTRMKSELEKRISIAPPLPPHPFNAVPSLSLAVDAKEDSDYQPFTI